MEFAKLQNPTCRTKKHNQAQTVFKSETVKQEEDGKTSSITWALLSG